MYTVVLMAALTTSPAVPDFGHRRRGHGCCGGYSGCCGGGYGGCCGGGSYGGGCCGGGCYGGGYAGCAGGGCGGVAYGSGGSPYAAMPYDGGYYAGGSYNGMQSYGGTAPAGTYYGQPAPGSMQQGPGTGAPAGGTAPRPPNPGNRTGGTEESSSVQGPAPATIVVNVPANAVLRFDGVPTRSTSATRVFTSPPLEPGSKYYYTVTGQITREGQPVTATQRVYVEAGQTSRVALNFPTTEATASR